MADPARVAELSPQAARAPAPQLAQLFGTTAVTAFTVPGTPAVTAFTVPAAQTLIVTDVLVTNTGTAAACGASNIFCTCSLQ